MHVTQSPGSQVRADHHSGGKASLGGNCVLVAAFPLPQRAFLRMALYRGRRTPQSPLLKGSVGLWKHQQAAGITASSFEHPLLDRAKMGRSGSMRISEALIGLGAPTGIQLLWKSSGPSQPFLGLRVSLEPPKAIMITMCQAWGIWS